MKPATAMAAASTPPASEHLPALIGRLGDQVAELFDTKIGLLKVEVKEEVNVYLHGGVLIAVGGLIAAVGFALVNVAAALGVSLLLTRYGLTTTASYAAGFVTTGVFYLIVGGLVALVVKNRLTQHSPAPARTIAELRKDKEWLTKEL